MIADMISGEMGLFISTAALYTFIILLIGISAGERLEKKKIEKINRRRYGRI